MSFGPPDWPPTNPTWLDNLVLLLFATAAAFMSELYKAANTNSRVNWGRTLIKTGAASVVGVLVILACGELGVSYRWTGVIVGVSGWLGVEVSMSLLEKLVRKKLGLENVLTNSNQSDVLVNKSEGTLLQISTGDSPDHRDGAS